MNMTSIIITITNKDDVNHEKKLNKKEALDLELKLNVSKYRREWSNIGDILFNFQANATENASLLVTQQQFNYLTMLMGKESWRECQNL